MVNIDKNELRLTEKLDITLAQSCIIILTCINTRCLIRSFIKLCNCYLDVFKFT